MGPKYKILIAILLEDAAKTMLNDTLWAISDPNVIKVANYCFPHFLQVFAEKGIYFHKSFSCNYIGLV